MSEHFHAWAYDPSDDEVGDSPDYSAAGLTDEELFGELGYDPGDDNDEVACLACAIWDAIVAYELESDSKLDLDALCDFWSAVALVKDEEELTDITLRLGTHKGRYAVGLVGYASPENQQWAIKGAARTIEKINAKRSNHQN